MKEGDQTATYIVQLWLLKDLRLFVNIDTQTHTHEVEEKQRNFLSYK